MIFVTLDNFYEALVSLFSRRKVILWVCKGIVEVKVVYFDRNSLELRVSSFDWAKPFIVKHGLCKSEITCV